MNPSIVAETFLERLRNSTAQSHQELEGLPVSVSIISPKVTSQDYVAYLALMHDVIKDAEENIFPILAPVIPDLEERNKTHLLEADLINLGHAKIAYARAITNGLSSCTTAFALGIMYVIEGSTLGGRFILKNINATLGHDEAHGAAYFSGYGNQTGSRWKNFLNLMVAYESEHNCETEITAGANYAFNAISRHLS
jgi:heme oxygenase